jgi:hypothetical protein
MNLPPAFNNKGVDGIISFLVRKYQSDLAVNNKIPIGGEINEFFPLVHKALISKQLTENIDRDKMVLFVEEDPPEKIDTETITFYIQARSPGQFSQGPAGTGTHREVRHHIRSIKAHNDRPGETLVSAGKFYDNSIRFNVYAKTNKQARQRLIWFTKTIDQYLWYFEMSGYKVVERGVGDRERVEIDGYGTITKYPVSYYVRSEDIMHFGTQELKQVVLALDVDTSI